MVIEKSVQVNITFRNITYYKDKGYECKTNENTEVKIEDLNPTSKIRIHAQCSICSGITELSYQKYNVNLNREGWGFYSCKPCSRTKRELTTNKLYGVDNYRLLDGCTEQIKKTNLERYGDENYNNPEKFNQTMIENYGVKWAMESPEIREKSVETTIKNWGVPSFSQTEEFLIRTRQTKLERYGDENYTNQEQAVETNMERYGVPYYMQTEEFLDKCIVTNQKNRGVDWPMQSPEVREKSKQTLLKLFGVTHYAKTEQFLIDVKKTLFERYGDENYNNREQAMKTKEERYGDPFYMNVEKAKETRISKGHQIPDELLTDFQIYSKKVRNSSRQKFNELFEWWDGNDYYDNEYIGDYKEKKINSIHPNYPNVDHIIPVIYGFVNNISAEEIAAISNLCITKRINNLRKGKKLKDFFEVKKIN